MNKNKLDHIVLLRSIAIILVVFGHATRSMFVPNPHMYSPVFTPWWETNIRSYIYSFHMPLFFWISGFVFYYSSMHRSKVKSIFPQIVGKVKRLVVPMYTVSFFVLLPTIILFGHVNDSLLQQVKLFVLAANNDHLWFLKSLFLIFVIVIPLASVLDANSKLLFSLPFIWGVLYLLKIPYLESPIKYLPFFIIGFYWCKYEHKFHKLNSVNSFVFLFVMHFLVLLINKLELFQINGTLVWYLVATMGIYYMYVFASISVNRISKSRLWNITELIDKSSYSIYLWHVSFLYFVLYLFSKFSLDNSVIRVVFSFLLGLSGSLVIHYVLSKAGKISVLFGIPSKNK